MSGDVEEFNQLPQFFRDALLVQANWMMHDDSIDMDNAIEDGIEVPAPVIAAVELTRGWYNEDPNRWFRMMVIAMAVAAA